MTESTNYNVMLTGELTGERSDTVAALAKLFKKSDEQIEKLIGSAPVAIKKDVEQTVAEKYQKAIEASGAKVHLEPLKKPSHSSWSLEPTEEELTQKAEAPVESNVTGKASFQVKDVEPEAALDRPVESPSESDSNLYASPESQVLEDDGSISGKMRLMDVYFSFDGRINRSTFWLRYVLPIFIGSFVYGILWGLMPMVFGALGVVLAIPLFWASIAVSVKRFHDIDFSGWWYLLNFVPVIGIAVLIMNGFIPGTAGANRFGYPEE